MTARGFRLMAQALRDASPEIIDRVVLVLMAENPRFDPGRFRQAITDASTTTITKPERTDATR